MKHIFYFFGLFAIFYEIGLIRNPKKHRDASVALIERLKNKKPDEKISKEDAGFMLLNLGYMIWCLVGLFSFEWILFAFIILISVLNIKKHLVLFWIDALLSLFLVTFIILNAYHFHVDVSCVFIYLFKK